MQELLARLEHVSTRIAQGELDEPLVLDGQFVRIHHE